MLSFIIFLSLFTNSIANLNFDIRWTDKKIIIQEVLTTNIEEYSVNKFVSEFMRIHKPGDGENNMLERLTITKEPSHCVYFFQNNHIEHFRDNLDRRYEKRLDKHNWYSYNKIFVPSHIGLEECFDIFQHKFGSYLILSGNAGENDDVRINDFIKRFHLYLMIVNGNEESNWLYYLYVLASLFILCGLIYIVRKRTKQTRYMLKVMKFLKDRNTFPNNL